MVAAASGAAGVVYEQAMLSQAVGFLRERAGYHPGPHSVWIVITGCITFIRARHATPGAAGAARKVSPEPFNNPFNIENLRWYMHFCLSHITLIWKSHGTICSYRPISTARSTPCSPGTRPRPQIIPSQSSSTCHQLSLTAAAG